MKLGNKSIVTITFLEKMKTFRNKIVLNFIIIHFLFKKFNGVRNNL